jgi:hypothetical protein
MTSTLQNKTAVVTGAPPASDSPSPSGSQPTARQIDGDDGVAGE